MSTATEHTIAQEAGAWLYRLREDCSQEEKAEFCAWLQASPQHVAEFLLATATDIELGSLADHEQPDIDALLAELQNVRPLGNAAIERKQKNRYPAWLMATAAALALAVLATIFRQPQTYSTQTGEQRIIKLTDSSVVQLNTRSRIKVDFSQHARVVHLIEGEALFTVEREAGRPFEVHSGSVKVQAIGTQFNVYRHARGATVSVLEGRVKVLAKAPLVLDAGQQAAIEPDGRVVPSDRPEIARAVAWRQRRLEFRSTTLAEVAAEFNRYNRLQIVVADETLAKRVMSGLFDADDVDSLVAFLRADGDLAFEQRSGELIVRLQAGAPMP